MEYLETHDPIYRYAAEILHQQARKEIEILDKNRAVEIAKNVGKLFKKGS